MFENEFINENDVFTEIWNTGRLQCVTEEEIEQNGAMKVDIISQNFVSLVFFGMFLAGYKHFYLCDISSITVYDEQHTNSMYLFN